MPAKKQQMTDEAHTKRKAERMIVASGAPDEFEKVLQKVVVERMINRPITDKDY